MASELEKIRFQIAVQEEVVRIERKKARTAFDEAEQKREDKDYLVFRERETAQRLIVFDEEKKLKDLQTAEQECLYRKR